MIEEQTNDKCPHCGIKGQKLTEWIYRCHKCGTNYNPRKIKVEVPDEEDAVYAKIAEEISTPFVPAPKPAKKKAKKKAAKKKVKK